MAAQPQQIYLDALASYEPISSLTPEQIADLATQSTWKQLDAGKCVFQEGESDLQSIYLLQGQLELSSNGNGQKICLSADSAEARYPLADDKPRRYTAVCKTPVLIICIDKELLDTLLTWTQISAPEEEVVMCAEGIITINKGEWLKTMIKSPTFRKLPPANVEALLNRLEPIMVQAGDVIIRQGDQGDYFYMIDAGTAMVMSNPDNDEDSIVMAELNKGDTFGEAALISNNPRNATVSMMSDGILLRLAKEDFIELLKEPTLQWYSLEKARQAIDQGARWIDVRLPPEYARNHLPDALSLPMRSLHKLAQELDKSVPYICYCETGRRSSAAAFVLNQYGLRAGVLRDGMQHVENTGPR